MRQRQKKGVTIDDLDDSVSFSASSDHAIAVIFVMAHSLSAPERGNKSRISNAVDYHRVAASGGQGMGMCSANGDDGCGKELGYNLQ
jgi:hypothetical protein